MSTRRARIKAVTSLPPRRRNAESTDIKNKQAQSKEHVEKNLKSPRTPRPLAEKNEVDDSILPPNTSEATTTTDTRNITKTPNKNDKTTVPTKVASPIIATEKIKASPKNTDKVSAGTTSVIKSNKNIFASPQTRNSPFRKNIASLLTTSPKNITRSSDVNQTKSSSPQINKHTPKQQIINDNNELHVTNKNVNKITHNTLSPAGSSVAEDYNVPSVPESITDETVMDGIVPLQQAGSVPKPIDLLKSEIISENVEVLFDPIVPLPSPSKVRPKLRPAPRLGPHRRNSIQGSASESEDETRRAQLSSGTTTPSLARQRHDSHTSSILPNREVSRVRNDSVCSSASQMTAPNAIASPVKEKQSKIRRQEAASRRAAAMQRKREKAKRESLTMYDLIFYNPTSNPIVPDQDEIKAKEENAKDAKESAAKAEESKSVTPEPEVTAAPAPQIKLGPNGEIVLDEQSLMIKPTDEGRSITCVVREGAWAGGGGGGSYRRTPRTADWSAPETVRFYRALAAIGTDFTLMANLFPDRSRRDLKLKFKKEERQNIMLVDKALRSANAWNAEQLRGEFETERAETRSRAAAERARLARTLHAEKERMRNARDLRVRSSRGSKALESTMIPGVTEIKVNEVTTADEIIELALSKKSNKNNTSVQTTKPLKLPIISQKTTTKTTPRAIINITPNASSQTVPTRNINVTPNANNPTIPMRSINVMPNANNPTIPMRSINVTPNANNPTIPMRSINVTPNANNPTIPMRSINVTPNANNPTVPMRSVNVTPNANNPTIPMRSINVTPNANNPTIPMRSVNVTPNANNPTIPMRSINATPNANNPTIPMRSINVTPNANNPTIPMRSINVTPNANSQTLPANSGKGSTTPAVPTNIESGSLVVLTVNDPSSPSKKMLQTYIAHGGGRLTPVSLPTTLLNSVVGYMKKGTSKNTKTGSPHFASPTRVTNQDSRDTPSATPGVIQVNPAPAKRQRLSSYTITQI